MTHCMALSSFETNEYYMCIRNINRHEIHTHRENDATKQNGRRAEATEESFQIWKNHAISMGLVAESHTFTNFVDPLQDLRHFGNVTCHQSVDFFKLFVQIEFPDLARDNFPIHRVLDCGYSSSVSVRSVDGHIAEVFGDFGNDAGMCQDICLSVPHENY